MEILLASHNKHKFEEIRKRLPESFVLRSLRDFNDRDEVDETGSTFQENSFLKANHYHHKYKLAVISDDSGLCVKALYGQPGVYSSRFAGVNATDEENNQHLLDVMKEATDRDAYFITCLCYIESGQVYYFEGKLEGSIAHSPKGEFGFGYDPLFILSDGRRLAELTTEEKNEISHRSNALERWLHFLTRKDDNQ